jgi:hypothetical protein
VKVEDYCPQGKRWWLRLHEKGGKLHQVDEYIAAAGLKDARKGPLFRTARGKTGEFTSEATCRVDVFRVAHHTYETKLG